MNAMRDWTELHNTVGRMTAYVAALPLIYLRLRNQMKVDRAKSEEERRMALAKRYGWTEPVKYSMPQLSYACAQSFGKGNRGRLSVIDEESEEDIDEGT